VLQMHHSVFYALCCMLNVEELRDMYKTKAYEERERCELAGVEIQKTIRVVQRFPSECSRGQTSDRGWLV